MSQIRPTGTVSAVQTASRRHWRPAFATAVLSAAVLAACGGGGGGGSSTTTTTPTPTTSTGTVKLSGVAATGAALSNAAISVACASGTGTATAGADGSYTLTVTDGSLPCVLEAKSGTNTLHSVVLGSGPGTATGHITPLTELMIANILGSDPAAFFAALKSSNSTLSTQFNDQTVTDAMAAVIAAVKAAGIDASSLSDLLRGSLTAGSGTGYDGVLDQLGTLLKRGGSTLGDLSAVLAASSAAATEGSSTGLLPVAALTQPKADTCKSLRSGNYWRLIVKPSASIGPTDPVTTVTKVTVDAAATGGPTVTNPDASVETLAAVTGQGCRFTTTTAAGDTDYMVSGSGIVFARSGGTGNGDTSQRLEVLLPDQTVPVASLAGKWNGLGWYPRLSQAGAFTLDSPVATIGADGKWTAVCNNDGVGIAEASCVTTEGPDNGFVVNANGGYDADINQLRHRAFAYQSGNGTKLIVLLHANGGVEFLTPARTRPLAAVGAAWNAWDLRVDSTAVAADTVGFYGFEITGVDAASKTEVRKFTNKVDQLSYAQSYLTDSPRLGWAYRDGGPTANSAGGTTQVSPLYSLRTGLGFTPYSIPGTTESRLGISVTQPQ